MFTADSRTENFLTQLGVKFDYRNGVLTSDLVSDWQKENIGRPVAIREDAVLEYSALMEAGSAAPAPILIETENGFRVLDGVQRIAGAELIGTTRISAYVVATDSEDIIATIRVLANARLQGRPEPPEWTRRRAVEILVIERGMSDAEVAQLGGWRKADVRRIADAIELQGRIKQQGGPELSDKMLAALHAHLPAGGVLEKAAKPVAGFLQGLKQSKLSADDATTYIDAFFEPLPRKANPFATYTERLEEFHDDPEIQARLTGRQSVALPRDVVLLRTLKSAKTVLDQVLSHGDEIRNVDEFFQIVGRIRDGLASIAPNQKAKTARVPADMWSKDQ